MDLPQIVFSSASAQCQWWQLSFLVNQSFLWVFLCYLTDWPLCFWGVFHQAYTTIIPHSFSSCPEIYLCCDLDKELKVDFVYWLVSTMLMIIISLLFDAPTLCYIHLLFLAVFTETPWKKHLTQREGCHGFQRFWIRFLDDQSFPLYSRAGSLSQ